MCYQNPTKIPQKARDPVGEYGFVNFNSVTHLVASSLQLTAYRCRSQRKRTANQNLSSHQGAAHLLLQHITSPPAVTHSDRVCLCRRRRQQPYCPLSRVRDTWRQSIGPIVSSSLRPNHPPGALVGILVIQTMADKSEPNRVQVQSVALSRVADQPVSSAEERSESEEESVMPEAEAPAPAIRRLGKHHSDKSVAGGGVIIGGLVTAIFAAVFCYIRVTRKRNSVH
ncbi:hypothetical protein TIFTF001_047860 [Ficus carica]|uniref:Uncharacterized protein n=1 Tax=Ficus carica TaxID=3494 RepID=A0AA87Z7Q2_FICCA|nr:hypothetical protein TIFTF001_047860 [Ficus carica]